jgi:hypothetical protein
MLSGARLGDEGRYFLRCRERQISREIEHFSIEVLRTGIPPLPRIPRQDASIRLPTIRDEIPLLSNDIEGLSETSLNLIRAQRRVEPITIADDPDGVDLGTILEHTHDVCHQRQAVNLEVDLALTIDGLRGATITGRYDRRNAHARAPFLSTLATPCELVGLDGQLREESARRFDRPSLRTSLAISFAGLLLADPSPLAIDSRRAET